MLATGIPFAAVAKRHQLAFARTLATLMPVVAGIRRFGSAALDLAWVAAGRYDGYCCLIETTAHMYRQPASWYQTPTMPGTPARLSLSFIEADWTIG